MSTTSQSTRRRLRYHQHAYQFVFAALQYTQESLGRSRDLGPEDEDAHISGEELLEGIRRLAIEQFGLMARCVFVRWGVQTTADFGRIVFELVERGEMRKTERDQLSDFVGAYDFEDAFERDYRIDTNRAFRS